MKARRQARRHPQFLDASDRETSDMINKVGTIILNEQRQLMTGFALLVFMMTLFAQHLQIRDSRRSPVGSIGDRRTSHTSRHEGSKSAMWLSSLFSDRRTSHRSRHEGVVIHRAHDCACGVAGRSALTRQIIFTPREAGYGH